MVSITVHQGDITTLDVDVIVNAANAQLAGGGGVDGAIHRAAGNELYAACQKLNGCPTGQVKTTPAFNLPAKVIFHAVGPIWRGGNYNEAFLLASCYRRAMELLIESGYQSIAFPAISCGVYQFPLKQAAAIAVSEVKQAIKQKTKQPHQIKSIIFCCFDAETAQEYSSLLAE